MPVAWLGCMKLFYARSPEDLPIGLTEQFR